jgi:hypothetical protein
MARRACCLLVLGAILVGAAGCWHVHHDYLGLALSGQYEAWAESRGLLDFYAPLNPYWWIGVLLMALDLVVAPFTFTHDLVLYLASKSGTIPAPWELDAATRWSR